MKADILTIHFGVNYGSALQSYALSRILEQLNIQTEVINYIPLKYGMWNEFSGNKKGKYPLAVIAAAFILKFPSKYKHRKIFEKFLRENLNLTKIYHTNAELKAEPPQSDIYIVGSDQVWNFDYNESGDFTYFFDFLPSASRKISYAASIGKTTLSKNERGCIKKYLSEFSGVSLREDSSTELLNSMGIPSNHVLDPTMLLSKYEWNHFAKRRKHKDSYILIYVMDYLYHDLIEIAEKISKKFGHKIYMVAFKKIKDKRVDKQFIYADPQEFLGVLLDASYVVTNSFHGVAFSVNFNKQFCAVAKENYNIRIQSLLRMMEIEGHFVSSVNEFDIGHKIDYSNVNRILTEQRTYSLDYLKKFCENTDKAKGDMVQI